MSTLQFPIDLKFKVSTLSNDFTASDANGTTLAYVRQKLFKFKEAVQVFTDESKSQVVYEIKADKWLDFSTSYHFTKSNGETLGRIARKGWKSLWKAEYQIFDQSNSLQFVVKEHNAWVKVWDSLLGEVPILSMFTGYLFNPSYDVATPTGDLIFKLKKEKSLLGRRFKITKESDQIESDDGQRIILGLMMVVLLERRRG